MKESVIRELVKKGKSLTVAELKHHLEHLPKRTQKQTLMMFHQYILSESSDTSVRNYLNELIKKTKDSIAAVPKYDVIFNPTQKVLFETALAGAIMENKLKFKETVDKVAFQIADILSKTLFDKTIMSSIPSSEEVQKNLLKHINSMDCCDFFNRYKKRPQRTPIPKEELPEFMAWSLEAMRDPHNLNIDEKMFLIYIYTGFISRPDRMGCETISDADDALFITLENKALVIDVVNKHKYAGKPGAFSAKGRSISRKTRKDSQGHVLKSTEKDNPPHNIAGIFPGQGVRGASPVNLDALPAGIVRLLQQADPKYTRSSAGLFQPIYVKEEGVERSSDHFYDEALRHNLPLVGAASGGAGTYEIAMALTPGLSELEKRDLRVLTMGLYISYGFHSLHEVCYIQKMCGSDYIVGDYNSVMFPDLLGEENYHLLRKEFAHILDLPYSESELLQSSPPAPIPTKPPEGARPVIKRSSSFDTVFHGSHRFFQSSKSTEQYDETFPTPYHQITAKK